MSRFNTAGHQTQKPVARATSPISTVSAIADGLTHEGAPGWKRTPKSELFLLASGAFLDGKGTFYESGAQQDKRVRELTRQVALEDPQWVLDFVTWLRAQANIRTAAVVIAAEFVKARLDEEKRLSRVPGPAAVTLKGTSGMNRQIINNVCQRPDEPGELLAYWTATYGRAVPKPIKRGVADAVRRLYHPRSLLKYDTASKGHRFGDVLNLVHAAPDPDRPWQGDLFQYALDRRHHPDTATPPESCHTLIAHKALMDLPVKERRKVVTGVGGAQRLADAGITWEALAGWLQGPMDKAAWEAMIPSMGTMALIRNLRNFDQAGVSDKAAQEIIAKLTDRDAVARSKQFPFRFLAAYQATRGSLRWAYPLEQALGHSLANVPALPGRTLILVDRSGSMFYGKMSERSDLTRADGAALFGSALAVRAESADLVQFGSTSRMVPYEKSDAILKILERFTDLGGTYTATATAKHYAKHDRVIIISDDQAHDGNPGDQVPAHIPVYTYNLGGYEVGHGRSGSDCRFTLGGLSDKAFTLIPLIEAGSQGGWPWQVTATA